jgi:lipopolysaccharide transport system permease protein
VAADAERPRQIIIEPPRGWRPLNLRELREYRDLFYFLVTRDVKILYKQTVLGFGWAIIRPLVSMVVFTIIFGNIAEVSSDGVPYPIFNYAALVPWTYFAAAMSASTLSLVGNTNMLSKVYFPRLIYPLAPVFAKLVDFAIAFVIILLMMLWFNIRPTYNVIFLPYLVLLMILTAAGVGMWLSALAVLYRDVKHGLQFATQLLMFAAPVVWPVSSLTERFGETATLIYGLYPMVGVIEGFRAAMLNTTPMPWDLIAIGSCSALLIAVSGAFYFRRMEAIFADVA